jgi:hypothetical protein
MPKPKKLKDASKIIKNPTRKVANTKRECIILGNISLNIIFISLSPKAWAASTYSLVFSEIISPLLRRKKFTQLLKQRMTIRLKNPGPTIDIRKIAKIK